MLSFGQAYKWLRGLQMPLMSIRPPRPVNL